MGLSQRHAKLLNTRGYETQQLSSLLSDNLHPSHKQAYKPVVRRRPPPGTASIHYPARRISIAGPKTAREPEQCGRRSSRRIKGIASAVQRRRWPFSTMRACLRSCRILRVSSSTSVADRSSACRVGVSGLGMRICLDALVRVSYVLIRECARLDYQLARAEAAACVTAQGHA